ncbi:replication initiator [Streptomyces lasiicapitis]|uniref:Plasmid replication initiator protein n=1 Tax=Streptomyces lasiicapitis TaxID=1923961 RepID=A0ABQ2LJ84_9ACTN|nr:replication initiator [Streptomyces lasiicapitis]GGO35634.1 plasmid replication initiator protein [Streptomyces lasiicapitis]
MYPSTQTARRSALEKAERLRLLSSTERDLIRLVHEPGFPRWLEQIKATGGCAHPIYLSGRTTLRDAATGSVLRHYDTAAEPGGRLPVRCRNRRQTRCEPCSREHAGDTYHLVRCGLRGGKGTPDRVQLHPRVLLTLTAPSFGPVHRATSESLCRSRNAGCTCDHGRPLACNRQHADGDTVIGQPLCPDCYDYTGHVLWHAHAGRLWNRFCHTIRRRLGTSAGIAQTRLRDHLTLSFAKVAEYQKRGAIHFHAVIRLDGPDGPSTPPPAWATPELLTGAIEFAAASVTVRTPYSPATGERVLRFGQQLDVHPIASEAFSGSTAVTDDAVAAYVAKYITKSVSSNAGGLDHRITHYSGIALAPVSAHIRALMGTCWRLGALLELAGLNLRSWAHTLGYRGHALTKSRRYSTTYGHLRAARADHQSGASSLSMDSRATVTESAWRYVGSGHSLAAAEIAYGIASDISAARELRREIMMCGGADVE